MGFMYFEGREVYFKISNPCYFIRYSIEESLVFNSIVDVTLSNFEPF